MVDEKPTLTERIDALEQKHLESLRLVSDLLELLAARVERLEMLNPYKA